MRAITLERSGSVVEWLSEDLGVAGLSLTSVTVRCVLEQDTLILALSTGSTHREDQCPDISERLLTGTANKSNQTIKKHHSLSNSLLHDINDTLLKAL